MPRPPANPLEFLSRTFLGITSISAGTTWVQATVICCLDQCISLLRHPNPFWAQRGDRVQSKSDQRVAACSMPQQFVTLTKGQTSRPGLREHAWFDPRPRHQRLHLLPPSPSLCSGPSGLGFVSLDKPGSLASWAFCPSAGNALSSTLLHGLLLPVSELLLKPALRKHEWASESPGGLSDAASPARPRAPTWRVCISDGFSGGCLWCRFGEHSFLWPQCWR